MTIVIDSYRFAPIRYPPQGLTSASNQITGQTYTVTQSTSLASPTYDAFHVFDYALASDGTFWAGGTLYNGTTGIYSGASTKGGVTGEWIQLQISTALTIGSYRIAARNDAFWKNGLLDSWTLLGSNDGTSWTTLDSRSNVAFSSWAQNTYNTYTIATPAAFTYYTIVVRKVIPESGNPSTYACIGELQLLGVI